MRDNVWPLDLHCLKARLSASQSREKVSKILSNILAWTYFNIEDFGSRFGFYLLEKKRLGGQELSDTRTQHGAAIGAAAKRRLTTTLAKRFQHVAGKFGFTRTEPQSMSESLSNYF